jgi:hypothetical protein
MTVERPTIAVIQNIVNNNVYTTCPDLLIEALTARLDNDWIDMHDTPENSLLEEDPPEIFEYYLVSSWFGEGMKMIGEPAMELEPGQWIWGRTESGLQLCHSAVIADMIMCKEVKLNQFMNR